MDIKKKIKDNYIAILSALTGAIAGLLYWKFIGCKTGTCPIKSVWYWSMLYGLIFGFLIGDLAVGLFKKKKQKIENTGDAE